MKGATNPAVVDTGVMTISIHAPMKGATQKYRTCSRWSPYFNPRTHEGCDLRGLGQRRRKVPISIHAPMKGATVAIMFLSGFIAYFNPRTHEGCDLLSA